MMAAITIKYVLGIAVVPGAFLIFGLVFLFMFRKPIKGVIENINTIEKGGVKLKSGEASQEKEKSTEVEEVSFKDSPALESYKNAVADMLTKDNLDPKSNTAKMLIRELAITKLALDFEKIYHVIYGSQINILRLLNENNRSGSVKKSLEDYFSGVKKSHPEWYENWDIDKYLDFLIDALLIVEEKNKYFITNKGVEFLVWITKTGLTDYRNY